MSYSTLMNCFICLLILMIMNITQMNMLVVMSLSCTVQGVLLNIATVGHLEKSSTKFLTVQKFTFGLG
ncbi:hypothetical protein BRC87_02815 [Halobacteriales archaeon QS_4_66_20]|nr:MAG: hypothetical protein BRC87_02815 [Halobacteriales archaeon QS_4_66_20]